MGYIGHSLKHYADFNGRAKRPEFWFFMLFYFLCITVIPLIIISAAGIQSYTWILLTINFVSIPLIVPKLSVAVRRLHDCGYSGTLAVFQFVISLIAGVVRLGGDGTQFIWQMANVLRGISILLFIALLIVCLRPSVKGTNKYGPEPLS